MLKMFFFWGEGGGHEVFILKQCRNGYPCRMRLSRGSLHEISTCFRSRGEQSRLQYVGRHAANVIVVYSFRHRKEARKGYKLFYEMR